MLDFNLYEYGFKYSTKKYLVEKYLKPEKINGNVVKEVYLADKILKKYKEGKFWMKFELPFKLNSLAWFLGQDGAEHLRAAFAEFSLDFSPNFQYSLDTHPISLPVVEKSRPKTIKEFLTNKTEILN